MPRAWTPAAALSCLVLSCLVLIAACSGTPSSAARAGARSPAPGAGRTTSATTAPAGPSSASRSATSPTPAPKPSPTATHYTDGELIAALPTGTKQLHGLKSSGSCLTMKRCPDLPYPGTAEVTVLNPKRTDLLVTVMIFRDESTGQWRKFVRKCPQGGYELPIEPMPEVQKGAYLPGERGTSRRSSFSVGDWRGYTCEKTGSKVWDEGSSKRQTWQYAYLTDGQHVLYTYGRTLGEAKTLATEYLGRLG